LIEKNKDLPKQNDGINLRHQSRIFAASSILIFASRAANIRNTYDMIGPASPIKKFVHIMTKLQALAESNKNVIQYVNPIDAGPNSMREIIVPILAPRSNVVKTSISIMYIKEIIPQSGS